MKKLNLLALVLSLMICIACAQQRTVPENMEVSGADETDTGASVGKETVANGAVVCHNSGTFYHPAVI